MPKGPPGNPDGPGERLNPFARVSGMQTKLHRWAAADPGRRFDDLFNLVHDPATLFVAFARVAGNRGANTAGVDGATAEMLRPSVVRFLDEMLRDRRQTYRIEEVTLGAGAYALGTTLRDARVRERFGMTVLAVRKPDSDVWTYNPDAAETLGPGMTLVVLGSSEQVDQLRTATK